METTKTLVIECPYCGAENNEETMVEFGWQFAGGTDTCWKCGGFFVYDSQHKKGYSRDEQPSR